MLQCGVASVCRSQKASPKGVKRESYAGPGQVGEKGSLGLSGLPRVGNRERILGQNTPAGGEKFQNPEESQKAYNAREGIETNIFSCRACLVIWFLVRKHTMLERALRLWAQNLNNFKSKLKVRKHTMLERALRPRARHQAVAA